MSLTQTRPARAIVLFAAVVGMAGSHKNAGAPPAPPPPKVTVARSESLLVQGYYEYNGHIEAVETVEIRARVKGLLLNVHFVEGAEVEKV
ncbi:MAG TPA: hypothetical protein VHR66_27520 [Gemmataceae bacterium]|jgi:multidrug efflux pump subunit AcrA (membrane-fusion protein)|nr:hypothetical protein [Gemmataceae bacterium]